MLNRMEYVEHDRGAPVDKRRSEADYLAYLENTATLQSLYIHELEICIVLMHAYVSSDEGKKLADGWLSENGAMILQKIKQHGGHTRAALAAKESNNGREYLGDVPHRTQGKRLFLEGGERENTE